MSKRKNSFINKSSSVYYFSPFLPNKEKYSKFYSPAAQSKVDYVRSTIKDLSPTTVCINCSLNVDNTYLEKETVNDEYGVCQVLYSRSSKKRFLLPLNMIIMLLNVFFYVLVNVKKNDIVILYHSVFYDFIFRKLKKIKRFKLIYEVEEIYADVRNRGKGSDAEVRKCRDAADAFIFPTELLDEKVNIKHKPKVIIYGSYKNEEQIKINRPNEKIVIVYSGTLMEGKGAREAIECAKSLDERYEIRIIGYGTETECNQIRKLISQNCSKCKVIFGGMKQGKEYKEYLSSCDIGLCIQPSENIFNATSFPSKILSYLNNGLKVVVSDMNSLRKSELASIVSFTKDSSPESVATAIENTILMPEIDLNLIKRLDDNTITTIHEIVNALKIRLEGDYDL